MRRPLSTLKNPSHIVSAAVLDFVQDYADDIAAGVVRPLSAYLQRFPEAEEAVAEEYLRMRAEPAIAGTDEEGSPSALKGRRIGRYRVIGALGQGGQGTVYEAEDERLGRLVALKQLDGRWISETRRRRLQREAEIVARIEHRAIAEVLDADLEADEPYIAMRHVAGVDLATEIRAAGRGEPTTLPIHPRSADQLQRVLVYFESVARALHVAHEAGVIHRDVKPANLMVRPDGQPVVLDFGLAIDADGDALTRDGEELGTPEYMAPEQIVGTGRALDRRTDVHGVGATLFEVLTGERPFRGPTTHSIREAIVSDVRPHAPRANAFIGKDLAAVVSVAFDQDPARRYASCEALAEDLRRVRCFEPIHARPAWLGNRLRRWCQRQPALATALGVLFLALALGLGLAARGIRERDRLIGEKTEALDQKDEALGQELRALDYARSQLYMARAKERVDANPSAALALAQHADNLYSTSSTRSALFAPLAMSMLEKRFKAHSANRIWALALSPEQNVLAALDDRSGLWLWSVENNLERRVALPPGDFEHGQIAWIVEPCDLVVGDSEGRITRVRDGSVVWTAPANWSGSGRVTALSIDASGAKVIAAQDGEEFILDLGSGRAAPRHAGTLVEASVSRPASGGRSASIERESTGAAAELVLSEADGKELRRFEAPLGEVHCFALSADGKRVACASRPGGIRAWEIESGRRILDQAGDFVPEALSWTADDRHILLATRSANAYLWRTTPIPELMRLRESGGVPLTVSFTGTGERVIVVDGDGLLQLFAAPRSDRGAPEVRPGAELWRYQNSSGFVHARIAASLDTLLTVDADGFATVWRIDGQSTVLMRVRERVIQGGVEDVGIAPGGSSAVFFMDDGAYAHWAIETDVWTPQDAGGAATCVCLFHGGCRVARGTLDGTVQLGSERVLPPPFGEGETHAVVAIALSPDGKNLAVGYERNFIAVWNLESMEIVGHRVTVSRLDKIAWTPNGQRLAVGSSVSGGTFRLVDLGSPTPTSRYLPREAGIVGLAFDPFDGAMTVACRNGAAFTFAGDVNAVAIFDLHGAPLTAIAQSPHRGDRRVVSADQSGQVFVWPLDPQDVAHRRVARKVDEWERRLIDGNLKGD